MEPASRRYGFQPEMGNSGVDDFLLGVGVELILLIRDGVGVELP